MFFKGIKTSHYLTAGLKIWSNALGLRFDVYKSCNNFCTYCFARALEFGSLSRAGVKYNPTIARVGDVSALADRFKSIFDEGKMDIQDYVDWAIFKKWFIECGTMGENFNTDEEFLGLTYNFLQLLKAYKYPLYICTKGNLLISSERYYDALVALKGNGLIVDVSLISNNDKALRKIEANTPLASARMALIERLTGDGVNVTVSCRPFIKDYTDLNFEQYITDLCERNVKSIHIRTFFITGKLLQHPIWKKWKEDNKDILEKYGVGVRYKSGYLNEYFKKAQEIAKPYGVVITGSSKMFFELEGTANKMSYEKCDPEAQKHFFPYTVLPILSKIKQNLNTPQVLYYDDCLKPILDVEDPFLKAKIVIDPYSQTLIDYDCCQTKPRVKTRIPVIDLIRHCIWNGWVHQKSYLQGINHLYKITQGGNPLNDSNGNAIYFYKPELIPKQEPLIDVEEVRKEVAL